MTEGQFGWTALSGEQRAGPEFSDKGFGLQQQVSVPAKRSAQLDFELVLVILPPESLPVLGFYTEEKGKQACILHHPWHTQVVQGDVDKNL